MPASVSRRRAPTLATNVRGRTSSGANLCKIVPNRCTGVVPHYGRWMGRIAIIGSGIAGLGAAWALDRVHDVTLYEADDRLGGHANTVEIEDEGRAIAVDTGFIVYNEPNYPNLVRLFDTLDVPTEPSDMSFSVSVGDGSFEFKSRGAGVFAQPSNLARPGMWRMMRDFRRFCREAPLDPGVGLRGVPRLLPGSQRLLRRVPARPAAADDGRDLVGGPRRDAGVPGRHAGAVPLQPLDAPDRREAEVADRLGREPRIRFSVDGGLPRANASLHAGGGGRARPRRGRGPGYARRHRSLRPRGLRHPCGHDALHPGVRRDRVGARRARPPSGSSRTKPSCTATRR